MYNIILVGTHQIIFKIEQKCIILLNKIQYKFVSKLYKLIKN